MRQVSLLPAGAQPWNFDIVAVRGNRFAYCATLAIYIYEYDATYREFRLHSIMAEHKKTIMAISWNCKDPDLLASAGFDLKVIIWNVSKQFVIAKLENVPHLPQSIQWDPRSDEILYFCSRNGPLVSWRYKNPSTKTSTESFPNSNSFQSEVYRFRVHPKIADRIAFGHKNGTISVLAKTAPPCKHVLPADSNASGKPENIEDDPCLGLEWDVRSIDYLLVANQYSGIRLIDAVNKSVITRFRMPTSAIETQAVSWVPTGPGVFVSGDGKAAILRLWNVSKDTPLENIKLRKAGFQALCCFTTPDDENIDVDVLLEQSQYGSYFAKFPARLLCTFNDGGVGLYNLRLRKWEFLRDLGHIETIFDCKFDPEHPDYLATASFDGTIKVWDVKDWRAIANSSGNEGIIYSISWSPSETPRRLVAATAKHGSFIWDVSSCKIVKRFNGIHAAGRAVYCVSWNTRDPRAIASCGADNLCIVHSPEGEVFARFVHPSGVFGCDWSPSSRDMLATACEDGKIRVYYAIPAQRQSTGSSASEMPIRMFTGHTAKAFAVKWSPLKDGIFASVSDDRTVRIWDYSQDSSLLVLEGHESPTRGIVWNPEIPWLIVSGSWDASLRCWDIRNGGKCIAAVRDHGADVYGIAVHSSRPFILASTSRDSTVRLWTLSWLAERALLPTLAERPLEDTFGDPQEVTSFQSGENCVKLCGSKSRGIKLDFEHGRAKSTSPDHSQRLHENLLKDVTLLFGPPGSSTNLWSLVQVLVGISDSLLPLEYRSGIVNYQHMIKFRSSDACLLERSQSSVAGRPQSAQRTSNIKDEKVREAAELHIQCGNVQKYCELLVSLGEWERALSVAPGVNREYWQDLCQRYITFALKNGDIVTALPIAVASGMFENLLNSLLYEHRTADGLLLSQIAIEQMADGSKIQGTAKKDVSTEINKPTTSHTKQQGTEISKMAAVQRRFTDQAASSYLRNGAPINAACCYMAAEQPIKAVCALIRGYELELAMSVAMFLLSRFNVLREKWTNSDTSHTTDEASSEAVHLRLSEIVKYIVELLATRCLTYKDADLAIELLKKFQCSEGSLYKICSMAQWLSESSRMKLLEKADLPNPTESLKIAKLAESQLSSNLDKNSTSAVLKCVYNYLISDNPIVGVELGLKHVTEIMSLEHWTVSDIFELVYTLGCVRTDVIQAENNANTKQALLTISAYTGALVAIRRLYLTIVPALFDCCLALLKKYPHLDEESSFPLNMKSVTAEKNSWIRHMQASTRSGRVLSAANSEITGYEQLVGKTSCETGPLGAGIFSTTGCHLPSHSETHCCLFTGLPIKGIPFTLDDGYSTISHCDALMWASVNRFSPLNSGVRMHPF